MKFDIEAMAREAGAKLHMYGTLPDGSNRFDGAEFTTTKLEAFARLIVERCAVECSKQWQIDGQFSADEFAAAIRSLLED